MAPNNKSMASKTPISKKNRFIYVYFPWIFPWPLHLLLWTGEFLRFIAVACYCHCASQQRIDEIYDFLAENASWLPIGPLTQNFTRPGHSTNQQRTKEADEGAHGPGNQAQLEMKIFSQRGIVKVFSTHHFSVAVEVIVYSKVLEHQHEFHQMCWG